MPGFNLDGVALGIWEPTAGYADPVATTVGFVSRARDLGAQVRLQNPVARVLVEGGRTAGVETADGQRHSAGTVILATGPWTNRLLEPLGVHLPLFVERQVITILDAPAIARTTVPCVWGDFAAGFYTRPDDSSTILLGYETPTPALVDPDVYDPAESSDECARYVAKAIPRIPALAGLRTRPGYASLYDVSDDRLHIIDQVPGVDGLYVVCGTSGHGFKLAPAMGAEIVELVLTGRSQLPAPFVIDRVYDVNRERSR